MKKYFKVLVFSLIIISCNKKQVVKETVKDQNPIIKDSTKKTVKEIEEIPQLIFTVQIAALKNKNSKFNDIKHIQIYKEGELTKYRLGKFNTYKEARKYRTSLLNDYPDAFIQALKNNTPIHINQALSRK